MRVPVPIGGETDPQLREHKNLKTLKKEQVRLHLLKNLGKLRNKGKKRDGYPKRIKHGECHS